MYCDVGISLAGYAEKLAVRVCDLLAPETIDVAGFSLESGVGITPTAKSFVDFRTADCIHASATVVIFAAHST